MYCIMLIMFITLSKSGVLCPWAQITTGAQGRGLEGEEQAGPEGLPAAPEGAPIWRLFQQMLQTYQWQWLLMRLSSFAMGAPCS